MTIVFVHGVPETPAVWDVVRHRLDEETVAVQLPGFGIPGPPELRDNDAYATWLADELRPLEGPIDRAAAVPGLVIAPDDDPYGDVALSRETAERLSARLAVLPGKSHYWMHQDPDAAVDLMRSFWSEAGRRR